MIHTEEPDRRARLITGLLDLAIFLEANPDVPAPHSADVFVFPADGTDDEKRAEIDVIAARIGTEAIESKNGHYRASLLFGPVEYHALAICQPRRSSDDRMRT